MTKRIKFNHGSYDMYLDNRYVGSRATYTEAQAELDRLVYQALTHGVQG